MVRKPYGILFPYIYLFSAALSLVKRRIPAVEIAAVHIVLCDPHGIGEALIVNQFTFTKELQRLAHISVVDQTKKIVVGYPCFLLWYII